MQYAWPVPPKLTSTPEGMSDPRLSPEPIGASGALMEALRLLLAPIARLCLGRGVRFAVVEEVFKRAFVDAALALRRGRDGTKDVSRVSTATGLSRREVTRLRGDLPGRTLVRSSPATQVFTRWMGTLHDEPGRPMALKRLGRAPSFEALAQSVTRDVHHRSLLDELCRLGLARHDSATDMVHLVNVGFAPHEDQARMFAFLGSNAGDHLAASVENVLAEQPGHLEQAIFADELSPESLVEVRKLVNAQWRAMLAALVPDLQALVDSDRQAGREARERVRIGLYSYHATMANPPLEAKEP